MPGYVWLYIFHPVLVTLLALPVLVLLLRWSGLWARFRIHIIVALLAAYAIDAAFALPRILFSYSLPKDPAITQHPPLPRRIVMVSVPCFAKCHDWMISGAVEEVVVIRPASPKTGRMVASAERYRAAWVEPKTCPHERRKANFLPSGLQQETGYCPLVDSVEVPAEGIFLVMEGMVVMANEAAREYTPNYLTRKPPAPVIEFVGFEVQDRSSAGIKLIASAYTYQAPGLLGLPPLIGCWYRPENIIWIMPPGDTGCGLWRWFTGAGKPFTTDQPSWLFEEVFAPPDRSVVPPIGRPAILNQPN